MKTSSNYCSVSISQSGIGNEINRFLDMLWMERGLSDNTLYAYRNDLLSFARWLQQKGMSFNDVQDADIRVFLASIKGYSVRTLARRLSCLRQFYSYQPSIPLARALKAAGCGIVMMALKANGSRWA